MTETVTSVFYVIVLQSCKAGLVICVILLFYALLGKRLSPATRHAIWLLVPLTLLLCVSVPAPFSVWNVVGSEQRAESSEQSEDGGQQTAVGRIQRVGSEQSVEIKEPTVNRSAIPG